mmetsp:Transcript_60348/g.140558  ORF Transcript_60348/g.140558 Transcript_60348/m.140558 type:complete len:210 (+) Transcript_60348:2-631(+)
MPFLAPIEVLCASATQRLGDFAGRSDALQYERLVSSSSLVLVASGAPGAAARAQRLLQTHLGVATLQSQQAQICSAVLRSLPDGGKGTRAALAEGARDDASDNPSGPKLAAVATAFRAAMPAGQAVANGTRASATARSNSRCRRASFAACAFAAGAVTMRGLRVANRSTVHRCPEPWPEGGSLRLPRTALPALGGLARVGALVTSRGGV